jgi:hypothetical protein
MQRGNKNSSSRIEGPHALRAVPRNIVLDWLCSFILRAGSQFSHETEGIITRDSDKVIKTLGNALMKHVVCGSGDEARLAIVPAHISGGLQGRVAWLTPRALIGL